MNFQLRIPAAGFDVIGNNNDTIIYDSSLNSWKTSPGSGGGAVSSVFGRIGAVIAAISDYDSDQIDNLSIVPGAVVSDALDYLLTNTISSTRTISTTSPLRIDGGASADLSANRTLSVLDVTNSNSGVVPQTNGTAGQALLSAAGAGSPVWATNFQAQSLVTTNSYIINSGSGFFRSGLVAGSGPGSAASIGDFRIRNDTGGAGTGWFMFGRNTADTTDVVVLGYGTNGSPGVQLGGTGMATATIIGTTVTCSGTGTFIIGMAAGVRVDGPSLQFNNTVAGTITIGGQAAAGNLLTLIGQTSTGAQGGGLVVASGAGSTATNSGALTLNTGTVQVMTWDGVSAVSGTGDFRVKHGYTWSGRNAANSADSVILSWGISSNNVMVIGSSAASQPNILLSGAAGVDFRFATTTQMRFGNNVLNFQPTAVANFDMQLLGVALIGFNAATTVRNIALFAAATTGFQTGDRTIFLVDRTTAPTGNPTGGLYHWSETGGLPSWRNVAGDILIMTLTSAATASAGAGAITPATVSEFMTINYKGNVRKIALYAN